MTSPEARGPPLPSPSPGSSAVPLTSLGQMERDEGVSHLCVRVSCVRCRAAAPKMPAPAVLSRREAPSSHSQSARSSAASILNFTLRDGGREDEAVVDVLWFAWTVLKRQCRRSGADA